MVFAFGLGCTPSKVGVGAYVIEGSNLQTDSGKDTGKVTLPDDTENITDLVIFDEWSILGASMDPYPEHKTADHSCDPKGVLPEEEVLEINTNDCGYAVVGQPIKAEILEGDWVELMMYHSALSSVDEPAEAHFSLWVGENVFWERTIAIPAAPEIYPVPLQVEWSAEAGELARIHLHNHGGNSWRVAYLKRLRGEAIP